MPVTFSTRLRHPTTSYQVAVIQEDSDGNKDDRPHVAVFLREHLNWPSRSIGRAVGTDKGRNRAVAAVDGKPKKPFNGEIG